jgi:fructose-1,6-bisphosphatase/inositol monophosphatase family enzyme
MVSNTEWDSGVYRNYPDLVLQPVGSIAYKLQLLSFGLTDYVITLKPKNLWDIAGGTVLLNQLGYKLYHGKHELKELSQELYQPPLLWCKEVDFQKLATSFQF